MTLNDIKRFLDCRVSDVGAAKLPEPFMGLGYVISLCIKLSDPVVETITDRPTHAYFHHYRSVNRALDDASHALGLYLQKNGYDFYPVAASQSVNTDGNPFKGDYSHKQTAVYCGLGFIGLNNLFIHNKFGPRVRLATVFTDCPVTDNQAHVMDKNEYTACSQCGRCIKACPAQAITPNGFDPKACSDYMKKAFQLIGRGSVCGICMKVCSEYHK
ncbi:MAG: epoxyqueuosine reductase [Clostridia bacterium]|nr:epoxyqueuosine reductase [Clostridia bacterium]